MHGATGQLCPALWLLGTPEQQSRPTWEVWEALDPPRGHKGPKEKAMILMGLLGNVTKEGREVDGASLGQGEVGVNLQFLTARKGPRRAACSGRWGRDGQGTHPCLGVLPASPCLPTNPSGSRPHSAGAWQPESWAPSRLEEATGVAPSPQLSPFQAAPSLARYMHLAGLRRKR